MAADEYEAGEESAPLTPPAGDAGRFENLVDMTAMVDIVFFLLIFFMITTAAGIISCINMPTTKQEGAAAPRRAADLEQDDETVTVRIDEQNRVFVDETEFPTEADLRDRLRGAKSLNAKRLLVKGHGNALHGTLVMVLDLGNDLKFDSMSLSVAKEEEPQ